MVGQGSISNRSDERLGRMDVGVILLRKIWQRELTALANQQPLKQWTSPPGLADQTMMREKHEVRCLKGELHGAQGGVYRLGSIGKPIAINIAKSGLDLMVYDLREEPLKELANVGARIGTSASEVGEHGEVIAVQVP